MLKPKVSIIIPVYNVEPYLRQCIDSVRSQTLKEIEIILIDDGSTDECPKMCEQFADEDNRIQVVHQKNAGVSVASNIGIKMATADWLMFVDSDDWLEDNMVEVLHNQAVNSGADIVCASYYKNYPKQQVEVKLNRGDEGEYLVSENLEFLLGCCVMYYRSKTPIAFSAPWGKIYKKSIICNKYFFPDGLKKGQDIIFNLYAIQNAEKVYILDTALYHYRLRQGSLMHTIGFDEEEIIYRRYNSELYKFMEKFQLQNCFQIYCDYAVIHGVLEILKAYGAVISNMNEFQKAAWSLKRFTEEPNCSKAIKSTQIFSILNRRRGFLLFLLKRHMYKTAVMISFLRNLYSISFRTFMSRKMEVKEKKHAE